MTDDLTRASAWRADRTEKGMPGIRGPVGVLDPRDEHRKTCPCCWETFTVELPPGVPDPGDECFRCRQDCDYRSECQGEAP